MCPYWKEGKMRSRRWNGLAPLCAVLLVLVGSAISYGYGGDALAQGDLWTLLNIQETQATVTVSWNYSGPADWDVVHEWRIEDLAGDTLAIDTVSTPTGSYVLARLDMDVEYRACGANIRLSPSPDYADICDRFVVPARAAFAPLVVRSNLTDLPDSIPHEASFEVDAGTIWLEFTPDDVTGQQGLWSKDFNGYENGGHLSIWLVADTVYVRMQDTATNYQHRAPGVVAGALNQVGLKFGVDGLRGWLNSQAIFADAYTGGLAANQNAIVLGAMSQGTEPWANALRGTLNSAEFYRGDYDFTDRWDEPPIPPIGIDSITINVTDSLGNIIALGPGEHKIWFEVIETQAGGVDTMWTYKVQYASDLQWHDHSIGYASTGHSLDLTALIFDEGVVVGCNGDCRSFPDSLHLPGCVQDVDCPSDPTGYFPWPGDGRTYQAQALFPPAVDVLGG